MHHGFECSSPFKCNILGTVSKLLLFVIVLFFNFNAFVVLGGDSISNKPLIVKKHSHSDIKKGERLFYGLIGIGQNAKTCVACHTIEKSDSFSWSPSAYEISVANPGRSDADLKGLLLNPVGKKMSDSHQGFEISDEQIGQINAFLKETLENGPPVHKKLLLNRLIFIGLIILALLALIDAIYTKYLRFKSINLLIVLIAGFFLTKITVVEAMAVGRSQNYEPDQPIKFSHAVHAGQNKINCLYCHSSAEYSKTAGIPSANVCLNCHTLVREGTRSGRFEINKIHNAIDKQIPIQWVKIHNLPDHVFFSHAQHVSVGKISCQKCHGPVEQMDRMKQVNDLSMGWCINCHRTTEVQFMNNAFYDKYEKLHKDLKDGRIDKVTAEKIGGTECMKCHY
jgi:hypothetical protein